MQFKTAKLEYDSRLDQPPSDGWCLALLNPNSLNIHELANPKHPKFPTVTRVLDASEWQT
ncbi:MAG: hypothetical protein QOI77_1565, partial [Blastocatellia bacterium]|nr:hypothetical protein [Blastocatellia bacterium]